MNSYEQEQEARANHFVIDSNTRCARCRHPYDEHGEYSGHCYHFDFGGEKCDCFDFEMPDGECSDE